MGKGRIGPNLVPTEVRPQPSEGLPGPEVELKIQRLTHLRLKLHLARDDYRVAPSIAKETALRMLIQEEEELSLDVGFGDHPTPLFGRSFCK